MPDGAAEAVLAFDPHLVGLAIAFQYSIDDFLLLVGGLRERGYRGHITCGGHVPTFCYRELLDDAPDLDLAARDAPRHARAEHLWELAHAHGLAACDRRSG